MIVGIDFQKINGTDKIRILCRKDFNSNGNRTSKEIIEFIKNHNMCVSVPNRKMIPFEEATCLTLTEFEKIIKPNWTQISCNHNKEQLFNFIYREGILVGLNRK